MDRTDILINKALTDDPAEKAALEVIEMFILPLMEIGERKCDLCGSDNCVHNETCIKCGIPLVLNFKWHNGYQFRKKEVPLILLWQFDRDLKSHGNFYFIKDKGTYTRIDPLDVVPDPSNKNQFVVR